MRTGHVMDLNSHRYDCAAKYLPAPGTYVLVNKQATSPALDNQDETTDTAFEYVPLLNDYHQLIPGYRIQRTSGGHGPELARKKPGDRASRRSQSPSGGSKPTRTKQSKERAPSRRQLNDKK